MKPAPFNYLCAYSLEEALHHLQSNVNAKVIAGGQSLMPMLNFRVVQPSLLVDISKLVELDYIKEVGSRIVIGALTRHTTVVSSQLVKDFIPVMHEALTHVAHLAIRNKGTIGGSLSHADPAAEYPMLSLLLDADIYCESSKGERIIPAASFFMGSLSTALDEDEILTKISFPKLAKNTGWGFEEFAQRDGDFAVAAVGVLLSRDSENRIQNLKLAAMGVGETPLRLPEIEQLLINKPYSEDLSAAAAERLASILTPNTDLHASARYRLHLAGELLRKTLRLAWDRGSAEK